MYESIIDMIEFFTKNNYEPLDQTYNLDLNKWAYDWPWVKQISNTCMFLCMLAENNLNFKYIGRGLEKEKILRN